jgi:hypothetical protein
VKEKGKKEKKIKIVSPKGKIDAKWAEIEEKCFMSSKS